jgi:hypothetical protein
LVLCRVFSITHLDLTGSADAWFLLSQVVRYSVSSLSETASTRETQFCIVKWGYVPTLVIQAHVFNAYIKSNNFRLNLLRTCHSHYVNVNRRLLTEEVRVQFQSSVCGFFGGRNSTETGFSPSITVLPGQYHSINFPYSSINY